MSQGSAIRKFEFASPHHGPCDVAPEFFQELFANENVSSSVNAHLSFTVELRRDLEARLPGYMVPQVYVALAALPRNGNGKVDRRMLPEPRILGDAHEAPQTPTEEVLAEIWAEVLEQPRIGVNQNFFELGGDSISSIRIASRAQQRALAVSAAWIFEHQTVRALAAVLDLARSDLPSRF